MIKDIVFVIIMKSKGGKNVLNSNSESFLATATEAANSEWWIICVCGLGIVVLLMACNYYQFNKSIWIASQKGQEEHVKRLRIIRHVIAGVLLLGIAIFLVISNIYMEPISVRREFVAYNINLIGEDKKSEENIREKSNITFDLVVRKCIFKEDEILGIAVVENTEYVTALRNASFEDDNTYTLIFYEKGYDSIRHDLIIDISKDFEMCTFHAVKLGEDSYVAPANTVVEASELYDNFLKIR